MRLRLLVFSIIILAVLSACAPKRAEIPVFTGGIGDLIAERSKTDSLEALVSLVIEKKDGNISGDAFIELTPKTLSMRVYTLGFLSAELEEDEVGIKSKPQLEYKKKAAVADGIRNGLMWWAIKDYTVEETVDEYILRNSWKRLVVDKKTMQPLSQRIELPNIGTMNVYYEEPALLAGGAYPTSVRVEVLRYTIRMTVKEMEFK